MIATDVVTEPEEGGLIGLLEQPDLLEQVVPAAKRDSSLKMTLLWITFQASVSNMYTGFLARSAGLSLRDMLEACAIGTIVMIGYGLASANAGPTRASRTQYSLVAYSAEPAVGLPQCS